MTAVDKCLEVLFLLGREGRPLGVREIARTLDMSPATVHRFLTSLTNYGLCSKTEDGLQYQLGFGCVDLAQAVTGNIEIARLGGPIAYRLRDVTGETVTIQIRTGRSQVCVLEAEGLHELRRRVGLGRKMALHAGASGRAILAFLPEAEIDAYFAEPLVPIGPNTITDEEELRRVLDECTRTGYAVSYQESVVGVGGIAVPIRSARSQVTASLSVSGLASRIRDELETSLPELLAASAALSAALGEPRFDQQRMSS
jgi:IclR family acetate operon transcriptional repressor